MVRYFTGKQRWHAAVAVISSWLLSCTGAACGIFDPGADVEWTQIGLEGHLVTALVHTEWGLYAGTQYGGVFHLNESDGIWESLGLDRVFIHSLLFVPGNPKRLLVGVSPRGQSGTTEAGIFASTDRGLTWQPSDGGLAIQNDGRFGACALAYDAGPPARMYMGTSYSILRSENDGDDWSYVLFDEDAAGLGVHSIRLAPTRDGRMWASLQSAMGPTLLARSSDWGSSWETAVPFGQYEVAFYDLLVDDGAPSRLWAGGDGGVYRSEDDGETWAVSLAEDVTIAALLKADDDLVAVGVHTHFPDDNTAPREMLRVYRLRGGTGTWEQVSVKPEIGGGRSAAVDAEGRIVVGTGETGVWRRRF